MNYNELIFILRNAENAYDVCKYYAQLAELMPSISKMFLFDQRSKYHGYDLFTHCCATVAGLPSNLEDDMVYLAALIHDIGKVEAQVMLESGVAAYKGHPEHSCYDVSTIIIPELKKAMIELSDDQQDRLLFYIRHHDDDFRSLNFCLKPYRKLPKWQLRNWCLLEIADAKAHSLYPKIEKRINDVQIMLRIIDKGRY